MDMMDYLLVIRVNYEETVIQNSFFSQTIEILFYLSAQSEQFFFFFFYFFFSLYKMIDSKYSPTNHKNLKVSIGTIIKSSEMLRFVSDHLKIKNMCKHAVKKLPFVTRYVPDRYKTQEICDKVNLENDRTLIFLLDCYNCAIKLLIIRLMH